MEDVSLDAQPALPLGAGERLRAARIERGMTLEQVAAESRIPQRQLISIEAGDFASLPGRTYAIGFTRTYAKLVGLDPEAMAAQVRGELDADSIDPRHRPASFEPGDPARVPSRLLGWLSILAVVLVLAGLFAFFRPYFTPAAELPSLVEQQQAEQRAADAARARAAAAAGPAALAGGPVVFTAIADKVWVRFADAGGKQLLQKEMVQGETYTVPADAAGVTLTTGRPEALAISIGGRPVAKLSEVQKTMKDVPVTAAALIARSYPPTPASSATLAPPSAAVPTQPRARATVAPAPARVSPARPVPSPTPETAPSQAAPVSSPSPTA